MVASRLSAEKIDPRRVVTAIVSRIPEHLRTCEVCLRSQGENRANEPLWERRDKFLFEPFTDGNGVPYIAARVTFNNVPIGWAELMIEAEGYRKMTMKVFVTPELRCRFDEENNRWQLLPVRIPWVIDPERSPYAVDQGQVGIVPPPQPSAIHVPGFLWKRVNGYFIIDDPLNKPWDRYVPSKIRGYNYGANDPWFSVDAQEVKNDQDVFLYFCGPNNEDPRQEPPSPTNECQNTLPQHASEPIGEIELAPLSPAEAFIDIEETDEALQFEEGDDGLCKD